MQFRLCAGLIAHTMPMTNRQSSAVRGLDSSARRGLGLSRRGLPLIADDSAIAERDDSVALFGHGSFVRDDDNSAALFT